MSGPFQVVKLHERYYAVVIRNNHGATKSQVAVYEVSGGRDPREDAAALCTALNNELRKHVNSRRF